MKTLTVKNKEDFNEAFRLFEEYQEIKIKQEIFSDFRAALSRYFIKNGIQQWSGTMIPMKTGYKFKRDK